MKCDAVRNWVTDYFEDSLSFSEKEKIEAHLKKCSACRHFYAEYSQTVQHLHRLEPNEVPALKREFLFQNIRKGLGQGGSFRPRSKRKRLAWLVMISVLVLFSFWNYRWRGRKTNGSGSFFDPATSKFLLEEYALSSRLSPLEEPSPFLFIGREENLK